MTLSSYKFTWCWHSAKNCYMWCKIYCTKKKGQFENYPFPTFPPGIWVSKLKYILILDMFFLKTQIDSRVEFIIFIRWKEGVELPIFYPETPWNNAHQNFFKGVETIICLIHDSYFLKITMLASMNWTFQPRCFAIISNVVGE